MGGYPLHGTSPGEFPKLGGRATDGEDATAEVRRKARVHLGGGGERGGRV